MDGSWSETRRCAGELEDLLVCGICKQLVRSPVSLGGCEHFFCRYCVEDVTDCPVCSLPCRAKDIQTDRQLATAVSLCHQLRHLLLESDSDSEKSGEEEPMPESGVEALPASHLPSTPLVTRNTATGSLMSVYDFIESPSASSPSATVAGRTRKRAKVTKRKKALVKSNELWQIGKENMIARCDSCDKTKKLKTLSVKFSDKSDMENNEQGNCECDQMVEDCGTVNETEQKQKNSTADKKHPPKKSANSAADTKSATKSASKAPAKSKRISPRERRVIRYTENSDSDNHITLADSDSDSSLPWSGPSIHSRSPPGELEADIAVIPDTCDVSAARPNSPEKTEVIGTRRKRNNSKNKKQKPDILLPPEDPVPQPWVEVTPLRENTLTSWLGDHGKKQSPGSTTGKKGGKGKRKGTTKQPDLCSPSTTYRSGRTPIQPDLSSPSTSYKSGRTPAQLDLSSPSTTSKAGTSSGQKGVSAAKKSRRSPALSSTLSSVGVSSPLPINKKNAKGETPLQVAAIKGDLNKVRSLLQEGATTNVKDNAGWTPLHEACNHGFTEIAELLLDHGAFVNVPGLDNDTPLHDAITNGRLDCVRLLVSRRASLTARNTHGKTPVDLAVTDQMRAALDTPIREDVANHTSMELSPSLMMNQVVLLTTGMPRDKRTDVQKCVQMLHGHVVEEYSNQVTHVVASVNDESQCGRTLKCMQAMLAGKWIVNFSWIAVCLEYKDRVSEEAFEVPGTTGFPITMAPSRARKNVEQQLPGLFDGCQFYLHGELSYPAPSREELTALLKSGGGSLLSREPKQETVDQSELIVPYHADPAGSMATCSYYKVWNLREFEPKLINSRMCEVSYQWVLDCIANFKILEIPN